MRTLLLLLLGSAPLAAVGDGLSPDADYRASREHLVTYEVDFSVVVTPPYGTQSLKVWLPLPKDDFGQQLVDSRLSSFPLRVQPVIDTELEFGNKFAYFEFDEPVGAQIVRHHFTIKVWQLRWNLDAENILAVSKWPAKFDRFRHSDPESIVVDDRFTSLVRQIVPQRRNALEELTTVMHWANSNFEYDHVDASLRASSVHALERRRGHCSDYHGFCASMGRALGHPTRVTYGINTFPKNSPSHCKFEAYLPPYGWVSFDVSETHRMIEAMRADDSLDEVHKQQLVEAANGRLASGFRDNTWFCQTRGTDYHLAPPAAKRVSVVRTAYIEADGIALPEPDPANSNQRKFAWMTVLDFRADQPVTYPFSNVASLDD